MSESSTRPKDVPAVRGGNRPATGNGAERNAAMTDRLRSLSLEKASPESRTRGNARGHGRKVVLGILLLVLVSGAVVIQQYVSNKGGGFFPKVMEVETFKASSEFSEGVLLDTAGSLVVKARVDVSPKVPGTIVELPIEEGKKVHKGDLLARLDDGQYRSDYDAATAGLAAAEAKLAEVKAGPRSEEVDQAKSALEIAQRRLEVAQADLARAELLGNVISVAELELRKANAKDAEANANSAEKKLNLLELGAREETIKALESEVERARANVAKARYLLDCTRVLAPISGTILVRNPEVGEMIRPETVALPLCVIADTSEMEADVDIQERDIEQVRVGQPCRITVEAYPDHPYEGEFVRRLPVINKQKGTVGARVKVLSPDDRLLPDMNCRVVFLKDDASPQARDILRVPQKAVEGRGRENAVYVIDGTVARRRIVVLGEKQGDEIEVKEGLVAGELVILPGASPLADGRPVKRKG